MNSLELKEFRERNNLTQDQVAVIVGVKVGTVSKWEQGSRNIGQSAIKLLEAYESKKDNVPPLDKKPEAIWVNFERFMLVPLVQQRAQAGFLSGWGDPEYIEDLPKVPWEVDREYKGKYISFEVAGDSMDNDSRESIVERDILLCREIQRNHWKNKLHLHRWKNFVIVHRESGVLVKRILEHDTEKGILTLHSLNPMYEDFKVNMDDLIAIFNVIDIHRSL